MYSIINKLDKLSSKLSEWNKSRRRKRELASYLEVVDEQRLDSVKSDQDFSKKALRFCREKLSGYSDLRWHFLYAAISGERSEKFIPHDIFINRIESQLNNMRHASSYQDKNSYDLVFRDLKRPKTYLRYGGELYYDVDFNRMSREEAFRRLESIASDMIIKPAVYGSGRSRQVRKLAAGETEAMLDYLDLLRKKNPHESFIIQQSIRQHPELGKFHPESLNTIKIMTCRIDGAIHHLMSYVKFGIENSLVDYGGLFAGLEKNGKIRVPVLNDHLNEFREHPTSGESFTDVELPAYRKAINFCLNAHKRLIHFDIVTWDIAIDEASEPVLIEINLKSQGVDYLQMTNGPLFGDYTERVLSKIKF